MTTIENTIHQLVGIIQQQQAQIEKITERLTTSEEQTKKLATLCEEHAMTFRVLGDHMTALEQSLNRVVGILAKITIPSTGKAEPGAAGVN
jgi:hypothetical protein